jgi:predicted thioesterase
MRGGVELEEREPGSYWAKVPHKRDIKVATIVFSRDGQDIEKHFCDCDFRTRGNPICRHVVAAVLAIQGGVVESKIKLGGTADASVVVTGSNTAATMGSGSLPVFATPSMIALMEQAACQCLAGCLEPGQTSVGTQISAAHTAASPVGAEITAMATIGAVFGRRIEFTVMARSGDTEIGSGKHTRVIVDEAKFMARIN